MSTATPGRSTSEGWRIGTLLGVPVVLARSWFVIAAVITFLFAPTVQGSAPGLGPFAYVVAFGYAVLLFGSVLVHEVSHALAARAFGMPATHIVINLWGGHTQFESDATTPGRSFVIAVVGPLSNAVLAGAAVPLLLLTHPGSLDFLLLFAFVATNGIVAVFNVVPGLPLDGGRMLEAVIWRLRGDRNTGTIVAGWGGRVVALGVVAWGVLLPLLQGRQPDLVRVVWAGLIGALLWNGAGHAVRTARIRRRAPAATVRALTRPGVVVPADTTIAGALTAAGVAHPADLGRTVVLLVDPDGGLAGVLDPGAASQVPYDRHHVVPAAAASRRLDPRAALDVRLGGEALLRHLGTLTGEEWPVRDEEGRWVGVLRGADVVTALVGTRAGAPPRARS